jgi:hypothetical protein
VVRLDRTIGVSKLSLTGVFGLMVRSRRTMTVEERDPSFDALFKRTCGRADDSARG